jgi:hypothetical protein
MAHVEPEDIGSSQDHLAEAFRRLSGRAQGADDFGFTERGGHKKWVSLEVKARRDPSNPRRQSESRALEKDHFKKTLKTYVFLSYNPLLGTMKSGR